VPAAAVIPAPIAYIKVAAVKKLVVGFLAAIDGSARSCFGMAVCYVDRLSYFDCRLLGRKIS
jgi:hypothetical protein